jgi:hypothetical protein
MVLSGSELSVYGLCSTVWFKPHSGGLRMCIFFIPCSVIQETITIGEFHYIIRNKI